jgi:hypothetical protein
VKADEKYLLLDSFVAGDGGAELATSSMGDGLLRRVWIAQNRGCEVGLSGWWGKDGLRFKTRSGRDRASVALSYSEINASVGL